LDELMDELVGWSLDIEIGSRKIQGGMFYKVATIYQKNGWPP
jgi:hypothetical protein